MTPQEQIIQELRELNKKLRGELERKEVALSELLRKYREKPDKTQNKGIALITPFLNSLGWSFVIATILFLLFVIFFSISPCN